MHWATRCERRSRSIRAASYRATSTTTLRCGWKKLRQSRSMRFRAPRLRLELANRRCRQLRRRCAMQSMQRRRREFERCPFLAEIFVRESPLMRKWVSVFLLLSSVSLAQVQPAMPATSSVPASRLAHIRHGINLSEWFAQVYDPKGYTKEHFESWTTASDIALIRSAGFDHVRLSVNPQPLMDAARSRNGSAEYFGYLDAAVKMILDAGLAIEIDMHPDSDFKERLAKEDEFVERFADLWSTVAQHYASRDPDRVFFEILNEPEMRDAYRWYGVGAKLAAAIRRDAPAHTIIAAGARWDDDDDLVFLEPRPEPNVV